MRLRLEIVQQRVVRLVCVSNGLGLLTFQVINPLQVRQEGGEIVVPASFRPGLLAQHAGARQFFDQAPRQLALLLIVSPNLANRSARRAVPVGGQRTVGQLAEPRADLRVRTPAMHLAGEIGNLLGSVFARRRRHHRPFVPPQQFLNRLNHRRLADEGT